MTPLIRLYIPPLATVVGICGPLHELAAQQVLESYEDVPGVLRIGPEPRRAVPLTQRGHTLILPEGSARGIVVFIDPRRFPSEALELRPGEFEHEALRRSVAVLHITTGNPLDFLFEDRDVNDLARRIGRILQTNGLGGESAGLCDGLAAVLGTDTRSVILDGGPQTENVFDRIITTLELRP